MCSTCNIKGYHIDPDMPGTLIMPLGMSEEINIRYDINNKRYFLSTDNIKSNFRIYRCPTCGKFIGN